MRAYSPMFEKYGVAAVIAGHDEMFERSFVDEDGEELPDTWPCAGTTGARTASIKA